VKTLISIRGEPLGIFPEGDKAYRRIRIKSRTPPFKPLNKVHPISTETVRAVGATPATSAGWSAALEARGAETEARLRGPAAARRKATVASAAAGRPDAALYVCGVIGAEARLVGGAGAGALEGGEADAGRAVYGAGSIHCSERGGDG
jgi:hypothetical protein